MCIRDRRTSVCQMARTARCEVVPVDMGMAGEPVPGVRNCRVASGTTDFTQGPAMRREQAVEAVAKGIALVREQKAQGVTLLATGEMGIGNTTTSSAVAAVLLGQMCIRDSSRSGRCWGWRGGGGRGARSSTPLLRHCA